MFGGHIWELTIILGLALVVFGPKRLPEIGGALGKGIREFKQGTSELSDLGSTPHPTASMAPVPVKIPVTGEPPVEAHVQPVSDAYPPAG
jgi:TatA/E family protein of Tat protein translocase